MRYIPTRVANAILERVIDEHISFTPMKPQKVLYILASEYAKSPANHF